MYKRKFILKLILIFTLLIIGSYLCDIITSNYYETSYLASYKDKLENLQKIKGKKTVFVGGSSVAFGINAEFYEKLSNTTSINMGLYAMESYDIYYSTIEPYINKGDTVVLQLEYKAYENDYWNYNVVGLDIAHLLNNYAKNLSFNTKLRYYPNQFLRSYGRLWDWLILSKGPTKETLYLRSSLNDYGDFYTLKDMESEYEGNVRFKCDINYETIENIMKYIELYESKGATVYISFPPYCLCDDINDLQLKSDSLYLELQQYFGDRILQKPIHNMSTDKNCFLNTEYHLTYKESLKFTEKTYNYIKQKVSVKNMS